MAKFYGRIGYATPTEDPVGSGIYIDKFVDHFHYGDVINIRPSYRENDAGINKKLTLNCEFSILADEFLYQNCSYMKYIEYMGAFWEITSFSFERPRLTITIGGIWNGDVAEPEPEGSSGE